MQILHAPPAVELQKRNLVKRRWDNVAKSMQKTISGMNSEAEERPAFDKSSIIKS